MHAYEPHPYAAEVEIVGAGMAAATEWLNALAAGASVVSVRRREPERRPLNLPRELFTKRGLGAFHEAPSEDRLELLTGGPRDLPPRQRSLRATLEWSWDMLDERERVLLGRLTRREGRFRVAAELNGADQVICATGFRRGFEHDPLLARLVAEYDLETAGRWIVLAPDSTVPALTDERRTLALAGAQAQWAFPAADTLAGMKYAARRFLRRARRWHSR